MVPSMDPKLSEWADKISAEIIQAEKFSTKKKQKKRKYTKSRLVELQIARAIENISNYKEKCIRQQKSKMWQLSRQKHKQRNTQMRSCASQTLARTRLKSSSSKLNKKK